MAKITADTLISEVLELNPDAPELLLSAGLHCFGCALAPGETGAGGGRRPRGNPRVAQQAHKEGVRKAQGRGDQILQEEGQGQDP